MKTIVIVDDNHYQLQLMKTYLKEINAYVVDFLSSEKAWEYIRDNKVDLVITDLMMPVLDGVELCMKIKTLPLPPFVITVSAAAKHLEKNKVDTLEQEIFNSRSIEVFF